MHGAGVVEEIVTRESGKDFTEYYILRLFVNKLTVMVPVSKETEIGLRHIIDEASADKLLKELAEISFEEEPNYNKRFQENVRRIKSGKFSELFKVIKELMNRDIKIGLATGERKLLRSAKQIVVSEISVAKGATYEEIEKEVDSLILSD